MNPPQFKKEKAYKEMIDQCVRNSELRRKDPKEHKAWREKYVEMLRTGQRDTANVSNNTHGVCYKKEIDNSKWQNTYRDNEELQKREQEAQKEVDNKRKRIAPAYSKGNYQYITDLKDIATLGRKV